VFLLAPSGNLHGASFFRALKPFWASSTGRGVPFLFLFGGENSMVPWVQFSCHIVLTLDRFHAYQEWDGGRG
jgi:hypothetical protein